MLLAIDADLFAIDISQRDGNLIKLTEQVSLHDLIGCSLAKDLTVFEGDNFICILTGHVDIVEDEDNGLSEFLHQSLENLHHTDALLDIEIVEWFVQQDKVCILGQYHSDKDPLELSSRQAIDVAVF